jgi:hypothetical protein
MAFSASNLNIGLVYDLTNNPKDFRLKDNTDYSDVTYSNILGLLRAVDPSGSQFYNNVNYGSPDIDISSSTDSATLGTLPLENSLVKNGNYNYTYTIKIEDMLQSHLVVSSNIATNTFTVNGDIASQVVSGTAAAWEIIDAGTTALTIVSATYSATTGLTTIVVNETLPSLTALAVFNFTVDVIYSKGFTQNYTYQSPDVCIDWTSDDCCSEMTITDLTAYPSGSSVTRLHTVSYPTGMLVPEADVESPLQTFSISPIWTGTWVNVFIADVELNNGIIEVIDELRSVKRFTVSASQGLCEVYSCLTNMATKYAAYLTSAPNKALEMAKFINQASAAYMAYTVGKKCGKDDYAQYLEIIKAVAAECGCGCDDCGPCDDQTPTQVVGCCQNVGGSGNTILIISTDGSITISANTVGDTTTFDIEVNGAFVTGLAEQAIAAASINDLSDVNTGNISAANGQVLVWSSGTSRWVRGSAVSSLVGLSDVDDTGLANGMILYYDNATQTFKFRLETTPDLEDLGDVTITTIASGQIIKWNGTAWVNVNNTYRLLGDVNDSGLANGNAFKWDSGTSRFIPFAPKLTLASLDDIAASAVGVNNRLIYNSGTALWDGVGIPSVSSLLTYQSGYTAGPTAGYSNAGAFYDRITDMVTLVGVITNSNGAVGVNPTWLASVPTAMIPSVEVPFTCHVGIGSTSFLAMGFIAAGTGNINIAKHYAAGGAITNGIPAGAICLEGITYKLNR